MRNASRDEPEPETIVQLSFEPLVVGVRPGGHFLLAAHFVIAPGYRISWKYPGEVGTATVVSFRAPAGFEVGPVQFPAPERYTVPGGYVGYGYEKEAAVFVDVKAPGTLRRDDVSRFDLSASWVACKKRCTDEHTDAFVELTTTYGGARAQEVEAALAPMRARLPQPLSRLEGAEQTWEPGGRSAALVVKLPGATPKDFISDASGDPKPTKTALADAEIRFTYDQAPVAGTRPLRGVIVASVGGKDAFYDFEASLPEEHDTAPPPPRKAPAKRAGKTPKKKR